MRLMFSDARMLCVLQYVEWMEQIPPGTRREVVAKTGAVPRVVCARCSRANVRRAGCSRSSLPATLSIALAPDAARARRAIPGFLTRACPEVPPRPRLLHEPVQSHRQVKRGLARRGGPAVASVRSLCFGQ